MMNIVIEKVDGHDHDKLQLAAHLLLQYMEHQVSMRDTNVHNILHYPGQVLYYDIARISHIIESTQYGKHTLFIAYADGVPAGIAGITYAGENVHLYILPEYRGYDIGRKLVQERVKNGGWFTSIHFENIPSQNLAKSCGFIQCHRRGNLDVWIAPGVLDNVVQGKNVD